jgi:rRNA maturation RNase YbeY
MEIIFTKHLVTYAIKGVALHKKWIEQVITLEKKKALSISYIFCSDAFLLQMNNDFLQHDYYTDIITFPLSKKGAPITAEIYISIDRVKENAKQLQVSIADEMARVMIHGVLHLCGYHDKTKKQQLEMRAKEDFYLQKLKKHSN